MNNIVIVTCPEDWEQCSLLLGSLETFLTDNSTIYLIWNDITGIAEVPKLPVLKNHVVIWTIFNFSIDIESLKYSPGWVLQQLLKLAPGYFYNIDYVVLDSKNLLIDEVSFVELENATTNTQPMGRKFNRIYNAVVKNMCVHKCEYVLPPMTPFVIRTDIVKLILDEFNDNWDAFVDWFVSFRFPSEFILHDIFYQKKFGMRPCTYPEPFPLFYNIYGYEGFLSKDRDMNASTKIIAVHRNVWKNHSDARAWVNTLTQKD